MTLSSELRAADWARIHLVVFDMDGTLYRQWPVHLRVAKDLAFDALRGRQLTTIRIVRHYRRIRERLGVEEATNFQEQSITETALACRVSPELVRTVIADWIDDRPLGYLAGSRYAGIDALFAGLRRSGRVISILSDYPARAKLAALGLFADHTISAGDSGYLKPHPAGLLALMSLVGAAPKETVLIGDRVDRDGVVARRAGAHPLIYSTRPIEGWQTFRRYDDPLFDPILKS